MTSGLAHNDTPDELNEITPEHSQLKWHQSISDGVCRHPEFEPTFEKWECCLFNVIPGLGDTPSQEESHGSDIDRIPSGAEDEGVQHYHREDVPPGCHPKGVLDGVVQPTVPGVREDTVE